MRESPYEPEANGGSWVNFKGGMAMRDEKLDPIAFARRRIAQRLDLI
jgi:hypothetical protein